MKLAEISHVQPRLFQKLECFHNLILGKVQMKWKLDMRELFCIWKGWVLLKREGLSRTSEYVISLLTAKLALTYFRSMVDMFEICYEYVSQDDHSYYSHVPKFIHISNVYKIYNKHTHIFFQNFREQN